ncbi:hypothetical protein, partial [Pseudomonas syringae group genomosp. 3]
VHEALTILGLCDEHLRDAMTEIARHLLALGARLNYGGDLRKNGFSDLLFELVARHRRDADENDKRPAVTSFLAWPVHIQLTASELRTQIADIEDIAELVCLKVDGSPLSMDERGSLQCHAPIKKDWEYGLTSMRSTIMENSNASISMGGRIDTYKGMMPGIAEEALFSLRAGQPTFLVGGFGGCTRDIAETLGLIPPRFTSNAAWAHRTKFVGFNSASLNNSLTDEENSILAYTPHVDQAITLILRGMIRMTAS